MKFPRNARMLKGHLDFAPFASVFFCLLIFVLLTRLVYTPGVHINLPAATPGQTGVAGPVVAVALGAQGQLYFENQLIDAATLRQRLKAEVGKNSQPLTLALYADKLATVDKLNGLIALASDAGIRTVVPQTLPGLFDPAPGSK